MPDSNPTDLAAIALLNTTMIGHLLDEAEHYIEHDNAPSLQAINSSLTPLLKSMAQCTQPLTGPYAAADSPAREAVRQQAVAQYDAITARISASGIDDYSVGDAEKQTGAEASSISLMTSTLNIFAANAAARALAEKANDRSLAIDERWSYLLALFQAACATWNNVRDPALAEALCEAIPDDHLLTWMRLKEQMDHTMQTDDDPPYHSAFIQLCVDSGITETSPECSAYPAAVRFMIQNLRADMEWELGAWHFETTEFDLLEVIRFVHNGGQYVKLIHEPYPDDYPSDTVKAQMIDLIDTLNDYSDCNDPDFNVNYVTAKAMYEAPARDLHTMSYDDVAGFISEVRPELDDPAVANYLFRSLTGYHQKLGMLMTPPDVVPEPLATPDQTSAILQAARAAGMNDVELWELALRVEAEPEDFGLPAPVINETAFGTLEDSVSAWGIPYMMFDNWSQLFEVEYDE